MAKRLGLLLLAFISSGVLADGAPPGARIKNAHRVWQAIAPSDGATMYVSPSSIHRADDFVDVWAVIDFKSPQSHPQLASPFLSEKFEDRFDCAAKKHQIVALIFHPASMGTGAAISASYKPGEWQAVEPGTGTERLMAVACEKSSKVALRALR